MMEVLKALGFMLAGALISEFYNLRSWSRYKEGKNEAAKAGRNTP